MTAISFRVADRHPARPRLAQRVVVGDPWDDPQPGSHCAPAIQLTSLFDELDLAERSPTTDILQCEVGTPEPEVSAKLRLRADERVLHLRRVRSAAAQPLAILDNHVPARFVDLGAAELAAEGLYKVLRAAGVRMQVANERIGARGATAEEAALLDEFPDSPLLTMDRLTSDDSGRPVEWARHVYRPSLCTFAVTVVSTTAVVSSRTPDLRRP